MYFRVGLYVCVRVHVCMVLCVYVRVCVCYGMCLRMFMYECAPVCSYMCVSVCLFMCVRVCSCGYACVFVYVCVWRYRVGRGPHLGRDGPVYIRVCIYALWTYFGCYDMLCAVGGRGRVGCTCKTHA